MSKILRPALGGAKDHITAYGCDVKRGNLYAEQGVIGDDALIRRAKSLG